MPSSSSKRIAIIGAGPSGAIALDSFLDAGFTEIVIFERNRVVGGTWNLDEHLGFEENEPLLGIHDDLHHVGSPSKVPKEVLNNDGPVKLKHPNSRSPFSGSSLYPQVETNVLAELMAFSKKPFPPIHPEKTYERFGVNDAFRGHEVIRNYVVDFVRGREKYVRLNTSVERAWQPQGLGKPWRLLLKHRFEDEDEWYSEEFDFIYVATGHFSVPNIPNIKGLRESVKSLPRGSVLHTKSFRDPHLYKDKKILLVGAGFSNVDLIQLLRSAGAHLPIHLSLRSVLPIAIPGFAQPWIHAHPQIEEVLARDGKLDIKFVDGHSIHGVDTLFLGTGYQYSYPFLKEYVDQYDGGIVGPGGRRTQNLFWSTWWKQDASLAVSASITDSVFWRFIENQSKASAGLWKRERSEWPTLEECENWEAARNSKGLKDFHTWWPHFDELFSGLAQWGNYDPGDVGIYLPLFNKGFGLKSKYWTSLCTDWLAKHPEDQANYEKTLAYLESKQITRVGL